MLKIVVLSALSLVLCQLSLATSAPVISLPKGIDGDSQPSRVSQAQCVEDTRDYVSGDDLAKDAAELCALRQKHAKAKSDFVGQLQKLVNDYSDATNHDVNKRVANAAQKTVAIAVACIDANDEESGCHNFGCVMGPEDSRLSCYNWALTNPAITRWSSDQ